MSGRLREWTPGIDSRSRPDRCKILHGLRSPEMGPGYTGSPTVRRYVVRNQIEVRVDDLDRLAEVIDAANSPKNVALTIGSPRFDLKNREAAELEAAESAVKSAMTRARALAAGAGQTLGAVLKIQQGAIHISVPGPPTGELEIRVQVTVTGAIGGRSPSPL